jgi:hypothetical protein
LAIVAVLLLAGCTATVHGNGNGTAPTRAGDTSSTPDFPSGSPAPTGTTPTTTPAPTDTPPAPTGSAGPTLQQRSDRLTAQTHGRPHAIVGVPGALEAAVWDDGGDISFWRSAGDAPDWTQVGDSRYPDTVAGAPGVSVSGTVLTGMQHATYIVTGQFTTDGSGLAVAYTTGAKGWGTIKAEKNGNIGPSGQPIGADRIGLSRGFAFADGQLVTKDCPQNRPISGCAGHEVVKRWTWTGTDFKQAR